jgi:hypothetical protein
MERTEQLNRRDIGFCCGTYFLGLWAEQHWLGS